MTSQHDHTHKLDIACMQCVMLRCKERDLLLAFVRKIASRIDDVLWLEDNVAFDLPQDAEKLLKELGLDK